MKLVDRVSRTASAEPARHGRPPGGGKLAPHLAVLLEWVDAGPDITMPELAAKLMAERAVTAQPASLSRVLLQAGLSFKKTLLASEAEREDVRRERDEWKTHRQPRMRKATHRLVFQDETGTTTKLTRLRGRARRGARLKADAPFGHWTTQTFIAGLRCDGLTAPWVIDHPMNRETFDTYVETHLAPTLRQGDVVILDNLPSHKCAKAEAILRQRGAWFLFLPPYSPDLNPIEMAFAKLPEELREVREAIDSGDHDAMEEELGDLLFATAKLCRFLGVDPERAVHRSCDKFIRRFAAVEQALCGAGKSMSETSLDEMIRIYAAVKAEEHNS